MLRKLFGDPNQRVIRSLQPTIDRINALEPAFEGLDDVALAAKTSELRGRLAGGNTLDDLLPEAFAAVREAARRVLGQRHYDVQLIGGMVLHRGQIAEMRTGEGKTLTSTLAVYLNALNGRGVHVVTVNDYLSSRDAAWMGRVYATLGLRVGCITNQQAFLYDAAHRRAEENQDQNAGHEGETESFKVQHDFLRPCSRREAYQADITYGTNNEFGFDYLRDNMVVRAEDMVQRGNAYAIVDEVDSILIDEARTPLIISAPAEESGEEYRRFAQLVRQLQRDEHFTVDEKLRAVSLTEEGIAMMERLLDVANIYAEGTRLVHYLEQALRAAVLFQRDREYVVRDGEVIIVDEFTGRLMHGRRYSEGLHQAIEAKEGVVVQRESQTLATITFQNYFRMYEKLAGMTGTAATEAEEFAKIYRVDVVSIPTHRPMVREDRSDRIYRTAPAKLAAVVAEVRAARERGQPVLVGTISIEKNETLDAMLTAAGIPHATLNAKQHEREGEVIAQAGRLGAVTLATNMAGRGVDVVLGGNPPNPEEQQRVRELGGLYVIGTERHEARRIDNQLRGRSGRQGDPGRSQFFVSLEDDLMRIFGGERLKGIMTRLGVPDDLPIENRVISKQIEGAQRKVEHHHFDVRKHLLDYDDVLNKHREVVYRKRREVLHAETLNPLIREMVEEEVERIVARFTPDERVIAWDLETLTQEARLVIPTLEQLTHPSPSSAGQGAKLAAAEQRTALVTQLTDAAMQALRALETQVGDADRFQRIMKAVALRAVDQLWLEHLEAIEHLRTGIGLRGYGQRDPLIEYKREAYRLFTELLALMQQDTVRTLLHIVPTTVVQSVFANRQIQMSGAEKTMGRGRQLIAGAEAGGGDAVASVSRRLTEARPLDARPMSHGSGHTRVGRNDPCPCGAVKADGTPKKYKHCHGQAG